ncbi:RDD family protein [Anaerosinus massiliensis]|uniref:RDD family protein n=1 Tax=Massilibacillus massiliensis TaxID=1806837 RepID=UPI000DA63880|nr:RDD family protein [Massilibacillus massiliensis]
MSGVSDIRAYVRKRVIAGILDIVVFVFLYIAMISISLPIIGFLIGLLIRILYDDISPEFFLEKLTMISYSIVESVAYYWLFFLLCIYFFSVIESFLQTSPGKKLVKLRITGIKENRIGCGILFFRNILKCISIGFCGVGYFVCFKNEHRQAWHDKATKTKVMDEENAERRCL